MAGAGAGSGRLPGRHLPLRLSGDEVDQGRTRGMGQIFGDRVVALAEPDDFPIRKRLTRHICAMQIFHRWRPARPLFQLFQGIARHEQQAPRLHRLLHSGQPQFGISTCLKSPPGPAVASMVETQTCSTTNCLMALTSGAMTTTRCGRFSMPARSAGRTGSVPSASRMVSSNLAG